MRVLLVSARGADQGFGGAERTVDLLRDGLTRRGHSVTVLAAYPAHADASPDRVTRRRADPLHAPSRRIADRLDAWIAAPPRGLAATLADADVVHTHNLPGIGTGIWELARRRRIPVVHTLHDYGLLCARSSLCRRDGSPCDPHPLLCGLRTRRLMRWAPCVDVVVGVSAHVLSRHRAVLPASTDGVVIVPPRVPLEGSSHSAEPSRLRRLGYVGALTREKGVDVLLAAAPGLARLGVSVGLAGSGPLQQLVGAAPVRFAGHLDRARLAGFIAAHDAGIVCSTWEEPAVPFAAQEWLAAGRPLICTGAGALTGLDGRPGVVGYDGSADGLVAAVGAAAAPERWTELARSLTDRGAERRDGDLEDFIDAHLSVYARAGGASA